MISHKCAMCGRDLSYGLFLRKAAPFFTIMINAKPLGSLQEIDLCPECYDAVRANGGMTEVLQSSKEASQG